MSSTAGHVVAAVVEVELKQLGWKQKGSSSNGSTTRTDDMMYNVSSTCENMNAHPQRCADNSAEGISQYQKMATLVTDLNGDMTPPVKQYNHNAKQCNHNAKCLHGMRGKDRDDDKIETASSSDKDDAMWRCIAVTYEKRFPLGR